MSNTKEQTELEKWLWYLYNRTPYQVTASVPEALAAIQSAIAEAIGKDDTADLLNSLTISQIAYRNQLRAEIRANLKAKGLLR